MLNFTSGRHVGFWPRMVLLLGLLVAVAAIGAAAPVGSPGKNRKETNHDERSDKNTHRPYHDRKAQAGGCERSRSPSSCPVARY